MNSISRYGLLMGSVKLAEMLLERGIDDDGDRVGKIKAVIKAYQICVREGFAVPDSILEWVSQGFEKYLNNEGSLDKSFEVNKSRKVKSNKKVLHNYLFDLVKMKSGAESKTQVCRYLSGEERAPERASVFVSLYQEYFKFTEPDTIYRRYERYQGDEVDEVDELTKFIFWE